MAYTPELTQEHSGTLRRMAWALGKPMTKTMSEVIDYVSQKMDRHKVCDACRYNSFCEQCPFNRRER